jgi:signal transduction histidine kinase
VGEDPKLTPIMDEMARQLATIQRALGELLAFARPATPALAPVNGNSVVERAIRLVRPTAEQVGVGIDLRFDPSAGHFLADEEMLYQAFVNLLMNALEASSHGGNLRVSTRAAGDEFEVTIADTGRGIPPEHLDQVFKPFFTTRHTGTGLGLPITREIIQRHGGRVTLESRVGEGTTVTMRLPMRAGEERASLPPEEA